jgi:hypothetical protein
MYCRVLNWVSTDVSEVRAASTIRATIVVIIVIQSVLDFLLLRPLPDDHVEGVRLRL